MIRAVLFGYRSDTVELNDRDAIWRPDIGVITLHRLEGVRGRSTSPTSLNAPKKARKLYEEGLKETAKDAKHRKLAEAERALTKAVAQYPQYAAAWTALGKVHDAAGDVDAAREAFAKSIAADSDYMPPYEPLIRLEMRRERWQRVSDLSEKLLELHAGLDMVRYHQAKASFFLDDFDKAEALARQLLSGASAIELAEVHQLLGVIHARKGRFALAASEYRHFLTARPQSDAAALMKKQLAEWEERGVLAK